MKHLFNNIRKLKPQCYMGGGWLDIYHVNSQRGDHRVDELEIPDEKEE